MPELEIVALDGDNVPTDFDCHDDDLNEFIRDDALPQGRSGLNKTTLFRTVDSHRAIAFVTLSADTIEARKWPDAERPADLQGLTYPKFPAVLIGRFAVHQDAQGQDVGTQVFDWILGLVGELGVGVRFITVDSYQASIGFYEKMGFQPTPGSRKKEAAPLNMFYDLVASGSVEEDEDEEDDEDEDDEKEHEDEQGQHQDPE